MNDSTLSQEEIDALLAGAGKAYTELQPKTMVSTQASKSINTGDLSVLLDIINYILQAQTDYLANKLNIEFYYSNVKGRIRERLQIQNEFTTKVIQIRMNFTTGVVGENIFLIKLDDALKFIEILTKQSSTELSDVTLSMLSDSFTQLMNTSSSLLHKRLNRVISVDTGQIEVVDNPEQISFPGENQVIHISYTLNPEDSLPININQFLSIQLARDLVNMTKASTNTISPLSDLPTNINLQPGKGTKSSGTSISIRPVSYLELNKVEGLSPAKNNIGLLLDISMQLTVELGRTKMQIKNILGLGEGSIIELDKLAGEPVDLFVNGKLIAKGEVVVIDENFGVRITEIVSPHERLDSLFSE